MGLAGSQTQRSALRRLDEADRSAETESMLDVRRRKVQSLLHGIPLPPERLETPDPYLTTELYSLQDVLEARRQTRQVVDGLEADLRNERCRAEQLAQRVGLAWDDHEDVASVASHLESMLDAAEMRTRRASDAAKNAKEFESRRDHEHRELENIREERRKLVAGLQRLGEGDTDRGVEVYKERMKALQRLEAFREDLERDFPHLDRLKAEIVELDRQDHQWDLSDEEVVEISHRLEELVEEIGEAERHLAGARKDLEHLLELPTLDQIESERDRLQAEANDIEAKRDRLMLLSNVIRMADQRFREEHQPDVLRRASDYLYRITNGRYDRLDYDEGTDTLRVFEAGDAFGFVVGSPLSQGTRDQIYLAVRLAIVDHLDEGQERLPVFLDEDFVNWDAARRARFYHVLQDVSERRQIFVFTCHEWLAREIESRLSSVLVDIAGTPAHV